MKIARVKVRTFEGMEKEVVKLAIFAEVDPKGEVFYNIQGQTPTSQSMVAYGYDQREILEKFVKIATGVLQGQTEALQKDK